LVAASFATVVHRLRLALLFGKSSPRLFFGQVRDARPDIACVAFAGFGCVVRLPDSVATPEAVTSDRSN
jgi:ABC-type tungstate transport system substrate-binding protein